MNSHTVSKYFERYKVADLIPKDFQLIFSNAEDKVTDVLKILSKNRVLSSPVFDKSTSTWLGFLDILDLLSLAVFMFSGNDIFGSLTEGGDAWKDYIIKAQEILKESTIRAICNVSLRNPWIKVSKDLPLTKLISIFDSNQNLKRIAVDGGDGKSICVVTQSRIIECLNDNISSLPLISNLKLEEWFNFSKDVVTVHYEEKAISSFQIILEKKISGVAIVDSDHKIMGSLSASDLKYSKTENILTDLHLPVGQYIKRISEFQKEQAPISCTKDSTMKNILQTMVTNHIHRIFIVDGEKHVIGVLSLYDIIKFLNTTSL